MKVNYIVGSLVEPSCWGTSCHAHSSYWSDKNCFDQKVHCKGRHMQNPFLLL